MGVRHIFAHAHRAGDLPARVVTERPDACIDCGGRLEPYEGDPGCFCTECGRGYEYDEDQEESGQ